MSDEITMRSRNARLRGKVEQIGERAGSSIQNEVRLIALEQPPPVDDLVETLQNVHDNLQKRAAVLIRAGVAKKEDFEGF